MKKIVVIGSSNTDMVVRTSRLPVPGETILGGEFLMNQGGKGANQAVAVQRLGGNLIFVARLGNDILGQQALRVFQNEGMDVRYITLDEQEASGVALISVDDRAENCIVVASGANMKVNEEDVDKVMNELDADDILLMQLEIPLSTVEYAASRALLKGVRVVLNPAPACRLPVSLLQHLYMITPNRVEAEMLTGIKITSSEDAARAADKLYDMGIEHVIITLGSMGCWVKNEEEAFLVEAFKVEPIDTTAAGDTFNGALCVALSEGAPLRDAVGFASKAASLAVQKMGAQASIPYRADMNK